jgi:hypothetical protein
MYACLFLIFTLMIRVVSSRDMVLHGNIFMRLVRQIGWNLRVIV